MRKYIIALAATCAIFSGCQKENPQEGPKEQKYIIASTEGKSTKTYLEFTGEDSEGNETYTTLWSEGDALKAEYYNTSVNPDARILTCDYVSGAGTTTGVFTTPEDDRGHWSELLYNVDFKEYETKILEIPHKRYYYVWPTEQHQKGNSICGINPPMTSLREVVDGSGVPYSILGNGKDGEDIQFSAIGAVMRFRIKGTGKIGKIRVSSESGLSGCFKRENVNSHLMKPFYRYNFKDSGMCEIDYIIVHIDGDRIVLNNEEYQDVCVNMRPTVNGRDIYSMKVEFYPSNDTPLDKPYRVLNYKAEKEMLLQPGELITYTFDNFEMNRDYSNTDPAISDHMGELLEDDTIN